jgi:hypothetical protein
MSGIVEDTELLESPLAGVGVWISDRVKRIPSASGVGVETFDMDAVWSCNASCVQPGSPNCFKFSFSIVWFQIYEFLELVKMTDVCTRTDIAKSNLFVFLLESGENISWMLRILTLSGTVFAVAATLLRYWSFPAMKEVLDIGMVTTNTTVSSSDGEQDVSILLP